MATDCALQHWGVFFIAAASLAGMLCSALNNTLLHHNVSYVWNSKVHVFGGVSADAGSLQPKWRHRRFWYQPQPHRFTQSVAAASDMKSVTMEFDLAAPALAYIWDHQVRNSFLEYSGSFRVSGNVGNSNHDAFTISAAAAPLLQPVKMSRWNLTWRLLHWHTSGITRCAIL